MPNQSGLLRYYLNRRVPKALWRLDGKKDIVRRSLGAPDYFTAIRRLTMRVINHPRRKRTKYFCASPLKLTPQAAGN